MSDTPARPADPSVPAEGPTAGGGSALAPIDSDASTVIERLEDRLRFYESFDDLIQQNILRSSQLLREAATRRDEAVTARQQAELSVARITRQQADEREHHRAALAELLDDVMTIQQATERLAHRVSEALEQVEYSMEPTGLTTPGLGRGGQGALGTGSPSVTEADRISDEFRTGAFSTPAGTSALRTDDAAAAGVSGLVPGAAFATAEPATETNPEATAPVDTADVPTDAPEFAAPSDTREETEPGLGDGPEAAPVETSADAWATDGDASAPTTAGADQDLTVVGDAWTAGPVGGDQDVAVATGDDAAPTNPTDDAETAADLDPSADAADAGADDVDVVNDSDSAAEGSPASDESSGLTDTTPAWAPLPALDLDRDGPEVAAEATPAIDLDRDQPEVAAEATPVDAEAPIVMDPVDGSGEPEVAAEATPVDSETPLVIDPDTAEVTGEAGAADVENVDDLDLAATSDGVDAGQDSTLSDAPVVDDSAGDPMPVMADQAGGASSEIADDSTTGTGYDAVSDHVSTATSGDAATSAAPGDVTGDTTDASDSPAGSTGTDAAAAVSQPAVDEPVAPAAEHRTTVILNEVPRAAVALAIQRHILSRPEVLRAEVREYYDHRLTLSVTSARPTSADDLSDWDPGASWEVVSATPDQLEMRLVQ